MAELPVQSAPQAAEAAPTAGTNSSGSHLEVGGASRVDTCAVAACGHVDVLLPALRQRPLPVPLWRPSSWGSGIGGAMVRVRCMRWYSPRGLGAPVRVG